MKKMTKFFKLDLESIKANDDSANGFVLFCYVIWAPNCFSKKVSVCWVDCVLPTSSCDLFDWEIWLSDLTEFWSLKLLWSSFLIQVFWPKENEESREIFYFGNGIFKIS